MNYYPGSVGDAFIAYAIPNIEFEIDQRFNKFNLLNVFFLKHPDWPDKFDKSEIAKLAEEYPVISTHRFQQFDFRYIPGIEVISIDSEGLEIKVAKRNLTQLSEMWGITLRKDFMPDKPMKARVLHYAANIKKWSREQILSTDKVLFLKLLVEHKNDYFLDWKKKNDLDHLNPLPDDYFDHLKKSLTLP